MTMWKILVVAALLLLLEPVATWGPWWRASAVLTFLVAALIAAFVGTVAEQLKSG